MKKLAASFFLVIQLLLIGSLFVPATVSAQGVNRSDFCRREYGNFFFGLPTWYKYLDVDFGTDDCNINFDGTDPSNYVAVGLAVFEILTRIAGMAAIIFVMYGAFQFLTSRGEPDKYAGARSTIINALIGLAIALSAVAIVNVIGSNVT